MIFKLFFCLPLQCVFQVNNSRFFSVTYRRCSTY